jgi:hypothetical protein
MGLIFIAPSLKAEMHEPPLQCEISRGAWCIIKGVGEIRLEEGRDGKWNKWTIVDRYWNREVGLIFEEISCADTEADRIEIVHVRSNVRWEQGLWNEATVSLRKDGSCELRLMVPVSDQEFRKKAASSLSGHIAACLPGRPCADNILSTKLYKFLE